MSIISWLKSLKRKKTPPVPPPVRPACLVKKAYGGYGTTSCDRRSSVQEDPILDPTHPLGMAYLSGLSGNSDSPVEPSHHHGNHFEGFGGGDTSGAGAGGDWDAGSDHSSHSHSSSYDHSSSDSSSYDSGSSSDSSSSYDSGSSDSGSSYSGD